MQLPSLDTIKKNWRAIAIVIVSGIAILFILWLVAFTKSCNFNHQMAKDNSNLANAVQKLNNINAQEQDLENQKAAARQAIADAAKEADDAAKKQAESEVQDQEAKNALNTSLNNTNAISSRDYNGSSTDAANAARCAAYPNSPECHR